MSADQSRRRRLKRHRRRVARGRLLAIAAPIVLALGVLAIERDPEPPGPQAATASNDEELPRGGTRIFPDYGVVAFYGAPESVELGVLGAGTPEEAAVGLTEQVAPYEELTSKPVYPAFELIATVAIDSPGDDGLYRRRQPKSVIREYLRAARENDFLLLLDIQPGRADFVEEFTRLRPFLRDPSVGIALDPEWSVGPNGVPGEVIGGVDAETVNRISRMMADIVKRHDLPQKLLVVHQFTDEMIRGKDRLESPRRVALVLNADGFGNPELKRGTYDRLAPRRSPPHRGFKLFYVEDTDLMSPEEVVALQPRPEFVVYE